MGDLGSPCWASDELFFARLTTNTIKVDLADRVLALASKRSLKHLIISKWMLIMLTGKLATRLQVSRGILLKILGGIVLSGSQNPYPILDKKM